MALVKKILTSVADNATYCVKNFDAKLGTVGALSLGGAVFAANYTDIELALGFAEYATDAGLTGSLLAASKQAAYSFVAGGTLTALVEKYATGAKNMTGAVAKSAAIGMLSLTLTYGIHTAKGTPKPLESTVPTMPVPLIFGALGAYKRVTSDTKEV